MPYTRISEYKHLTGQEAPVTTITYEYPSAEGDPYYPIPRPENQELFKRYEALADATEGVTFVGRLATYRYYNMDQIVGQALATFRRMDEQATAGSGRSRLRSPPNERPPLHRWNCGAGSNASVVRIGDEYRNQVVETGHRARFDDLDAMAELGVKAVRYPILWETVAPETPTELDFSWHDKRLEQPPRSAGSRSSPALVHHGSGPRYTSLLDPEFPDLLADYAAKVARRYPWIDYWNPVNEPLTTARFSCLYGHWHPHLTDIDATFRALVNQCLAIKRRCARSARSIPDAKLMRHGGSSGRPSRPIRFVSGATTRMTAAG